MTLHVLHSREMDCNTAKCYGRDAISTPVPRVTYPHALLSNHPNPMVMTVVMMMMDGDGGDDDGGGDDDSGSDDDDGDDDADNDKDGGGSGDESVVCEGEVVVWMCHSLLTVRMRHLPVLHVDQVVVCHEERELDHVSRREHVRCRRLHPLKWRIYT